jgi:hypothetical protein
LARNLVAGAILALLGVAPQLTTSGAGGGLIWLPPAQAGTSAEAGATQIAVQIATLGETMQLGALLAVIREEGLAYGKGLDLSLLSDTGGVSWRADVARIYDPATARVQLETAMAQALSADPATLEAMQVFFASDLGAKVAGLEVQARRTFLNSDAKDAAAVAWMDMDDASTPRARALHGLIGQLDLVELNVLGTLNANLALYRGMLQGGGMGASLTDDDAVARVAQQEPQARTAAEAWLYPYMALAYEPLSDVELDDYVTWLTSDAGRKANMAMFQAFDALFTSMSHDLGLAAARHLAGSEI